MSAEATSTKAHYFHKPDLLLRIKSMMIDAVVVIGLMYLSTILLEMLHITSGTARIVLIGLIALYEPIMVTMNRTIGQQIMGLRVRQYELLAKSGERKNINFFFSLVRYAIKLLLGILSLFTVHSNQQRQAIHDQASNSVMTVE